MRNLWKELKILVDEDLIRFETDEPPDWKVHAIRNIGNIKDRLQKANTSVHERLLKEIQDVDINDLTYDDPLANGIVDLGSSQYQLVDDDYDVLVGEKGGIRKLGKGALIKSVCVNYVTKRNEIQTECKFVIAPSEMTRHKNWVEGEINRAQIATNITDTLLQEIKRNVLHKISKASENALVDVVACLMEASIYQMPIDLDIEVTRNDRQSDASKKRKNQQVSGSRGNKPDLMIRAFFKKKWNEIAYIESGKWKSTDTKTHNDHKKLARFTTNGYTDMSKKTKKNKLYKFCIVFDDHCVDIYGFLREKGIKFYLPIIKAKIPLHKETVDKVEEFVHALLILRNGILVTLHEFIQILLKNSRSATEQHDSSEEDSSEEDSTIRTP
ncbi:10250_t:CDS:2 [Cetraspora pellucida]|uniref:10250_t:CDS:1 n=1 Tax=Cetraspora pellucida TaxID=1433469 RepID=A0ACA9Q1D3_9GLOM|nr:10250_t:CDS:2 [Cetraspora pellucida]